MNEEKKFHYFSPQALLFKMWNYGLLLPQFVYNDQEKVFRYKKNYARFVFCLTHFSFNYFLFVPMEQLKSTSVNTFIAFYYNLVLICNTSFSILRIYLSVEIINEMSRSSKEIMGTEEELGIYGRLKRKNVEIHWFFYITILYFTLLYTDILLTRANMGIDTKVLIITHIGYILDIQFQQLFITFKWTVLYHFRNLNHGLKIKTDAINNIKEYAILGEKLRSMITYFMKGFSVILVIKCFYVLTCVIISLFMYLDVGETLSFPTCVYFWVSIVVWISIEIFMVYSIVSLDVHIKDESKLAVENIYDIQTRIGRKNLPYKSMELFLLKSKLNELKFPVCGFFPLDWTLIYSMVAGITTYLVYLIQFREMEQNRSSAK